MAGIDQRAGVPDGLRADGMRVGLVAARWNRAIVDRLIAGAEAAIELVGAHSRLERVAGSLELPLAAKLLAEHGDVEAIVVLGAVVRGETSQYEVVSEGCSRAVVQVGLDTGVPIGFGVLTVEDERQALARSRMIDPEAPGNVHNAGFDATLAAVEMATLRRRLIAARD